MNYIVLILTIGILAMVVGQTLVLRNLRLLYGREPIVWPAGRRWPKVAIVLSLRGHDPFLTTCLRNLVRQDYPNFVLQVMIDSPNDPAWDAVRLIREEWGVSCLSASVLDDRRSNCSLKNSSIVEAVKKLPDDIDVVAFVDGDAITYPHWLRHLVTPFVDPEIGCCTGIRWFAPVTPTFGARLRCYWNVVAASMIYQSRIPWGGSMAVRRSVLDSGLTEEWSRMLCEDVHTIKHLRRRGMKVAYVPEATVVNAESTTFAGCVSFINRQMLIFRLYHKQWWGVVALIAFATVTKTVVLYYIALFLAHGDWLNALCLICLPPTLYLARRRESLKLDRAVRRLVEREGRQIAENPTLDFAGFWLTDVMFLNSMLFSLMTQFVNWRGITYRINGPEEVRMIAYSPFNEPALSAGDGASIV